MQRIKIKLLQTGIHPRRVRQQIVGDGTGRLLQRLQKFGRYVGMHPVALV